MAIKKQFVTPIKTSRSGKYTFGFIDGVMERWEIAKEQAKMNYSVDMKNQEARLKLYRERLNYLDGKLDTLQKERRGMEASQLSNQQKVNNANVVNNQSTNEFNARQRQQVELAGQRIMSTPATGSRTVVDMPGTGGGGGKTTSTSPTDNIGKIGDEDVMRQVSDDIRTAKTDADIVNIGMGAVAGTGTYFANQTALQQTASKANALNQMEERERAKLANAGQPVSDAIVKRNVAAVFGNGNQGGTYADLAAAREAMKNVETTTGATGPRATTYKTVGGNKGVIRNAATAQEVTAQNQTALKTNFDNINKAIQDVKDEREGLVAPQIGMNSMDLIGDARRIYSNKFDRNSGEEQRQGMRQLLDLGALYGDDAMVDAVNKLKVQRPDAFAPEPVVPETVATPITPAPESLAAAATEGGGGLQQMDMAQAMADAPPAPVEPEPETPKVDIKLDADKVKLSAQLNLMNVSAKEIDGMLPTQDDSPLQVEAKQRSAKIFVEKAKNAAEGTIEKRVYDMYKQVRDNQPADLVLPRLLEFASLMFPDNKEAQNLVYKLYRLEKVQ